MTPDERITELEAQVKTLSMIIEGLVGSDRYTVQKDIQMSDGRNIITGRSTGTIIATGTDQKLGFYGTSAVVQPATVAVEAAQANDLDVEARQAINDIIDRLQELGLIA